MAKFVCPKCEAKVEKGMGEPFGCPCCGYNGQEGITPSPYFVPYVQPIYVPYEKPWWYGDGTGTNPYDWEITWSDGTRTISTSTSIEA